MLVSKELNVILAKHDTGEVILHAKKIFPMGDLSRSYDDWLMEKFRSYRLGLARGDNLVFTSFVIPIENELDLEF
jgi:hypothetical protein